MTPVDPARDRAAGLKVYDDREVVRRLVKGRVPRGMRNTDAARRDGFVLGTSRFRQRKQVSRKDFL